MIKFLIKKTKIFAIMEWKGSLPPQFLYAPGRCVRNRNSSDRMRSVGAFHCVDCALLYIVLYVFACMACRSYMIFSDLDLDYCIY